MTTQQRLRKAIHILLLLLFVTWMGGDLSAQGIITLLTPNGGEIILSGQLYTVQWEAAPEAVKYHLMYSTDNGITWVLIKDGVTGASYYWYVPALIENNTDCRLKIIGLNSSDEIVGEYISALFTIESAN
jgi:hypothetical protein